ncbi:MAG: hypothetical protein ACK41F_07500 [Fimbriimonadaceae bacterium]
MPRRSAVACLLAFASVAFAQQPAQERPKSLFETTSSEVFVTVTEHATGAEIVEITPKAVSYPRDALQKQAERLAAELGQRPRGLQLQAVDIDGSGKPEMRFLRASFAVDGLIERNPLRLRLTPIARAFADGDPAAFPRVLSVLFQGEVPEERTIRRYRSSSVRVEALFHEDPRAIEYRIQIERPDPAAVSIPDRATDRPASAPAPAGRRRSGLWLVVSFVVAAGAAAGALVYSLVLRKPGKRA